MSIVSEEMVRALSLKVTDTDRARDALVNSYLQWLPGFAAGDLSWPDCLACTVSAL